MTGRKHSRKPESQIRIARERMEILLDLAEKEVKKHPDRSRRYVELARKIGMRYNVRLGSHKRRICRRCNTLLIPGHNSKVRASAGRKSMIVTCLNCGSLSRYPYKEEKKLIKR